MPIYNCDNCGKKFSHKSNFKRHMNRKFSCIKSSNKPRTSDSFECPQCHKSYKRKDNMKRHMQIYCSAGNKLSDKKGNINKNNETSKKDGDIFDLSEESDLESNNGELICIYCEKTFSRKYTLKRHQQQHSQCKIKKENEKSITDIKVNYDELNTKVDQMQCSMKSQDDCLKNCYESIIDKEKTIEELSNKINDTNEIVKRNCEVIKVLISKHNAKIVKSKQHCNGHIQIIKEKFKCIYCIKLFSNLKDLDYHVKLECDTDIIFNNVYIFDDKKLGKRIYSNHKNAGDVYIIKNSFEHHDKDIYKIGVTVDLRDRIRDYRTGLLIEPRLIYHFPCKNVRKFDKPLIEGIKMYNIKREIYKGNVEDIKQTIMKLLEEYNGISCTAYKPTLKDNNVIKCQKCFKLFITPKHLLKHECYKTQNLQNLQKYQCIYCFKKFMGECELEQHVKKECQIKKVQDISENNKDEMIKNMALEIENLNKTIESLSSTN